MIRNLNAKRRLKIGIFYYFPFFGRKQIAGYDISPIDALAQTIKNQKHVPIIYNMDQYAISLRNKKAEIVNANLNVSLKGCDVLIPKIGSHELELQISFLKTFESMNIPVLNSTKAIMNAKNKIRTLQVLADHGLPFPSSIIIRRLKYVKDAVKKAGGYPVILKLPFGTWGNGVFLIKTPYSLYITLEKIEKNFMGDIMILQKFIPEANGADYRAFVLGDKVIASMKRTAKSGDFRSNLHLGGEAVPVTLTKKEQDIAIAAAKALGLGMAGVDIIRSRREPLIIEVNANPGFLGISKVTQIPVAKKIVDYAVSLALEKEHKN